MGWDIALIVLVLIIAIIDWYIEYLNSSAVKETDDKLAHLLLIIDTKMDKILTAAKKSGVEEGKEIKLDSTVTETLEKKIEVVAEKVAVKVVEKTGHSLIEGGVSLLEKSTVKENLLE